jgi:hypothetical protein
MSIQIKGNYLQNLRSAKPTVVKHKTTSIIGGRSVSSTVQHDIPPINTDIRFSTILPQFSLSKHPGLMEISANIIPKNFNWSQVTNDDSNEIRKKKSLIAKPGNQALCGSCWAISGAGIIADNFVVSGIVDWIPNLSTTWSLSCYPQLKCQGGNPAQLFKDVAKGGIVSNHCIDYSWCLEDDVCNGSALKHFDAAKQTKALASLNSKIPSCGCYFEGEHYLYNIDPTIKSVGIGSPGITAENIALTVKKHIYTKGPAMGGFIVYKNFMKGGFANINGGVYFENGVYDGSGEVKFSSSETGTSNYAGSHAVAIVGWGIAENVQVDNNGKKENVPYWYCRNSWKDTWGEKGFFKMAMYPWNKKSQFDKQVIISDQNGAAHQGGGIVFLSASKKPEKKSLKQISEQYRENKKTYEDSYYSKEQEKRPHIITKSGNVIKKVFGNIKKIPIINILLGIGVVLLTVGVFYLIRFILKSRKNNSIGRRHINNSDTTLGIGRDTLIGKCSSPSKGQYINKACIGGSFDKLGKNTQINTCSEPGKGEFSKGVCVQF